MARVLVTDGEHRAALAVVRSLGRAGHNVQVASSSRSAIAAVSRFCGGKHVVPDPLTDPTGFAGEVSRLARKLSVGFVLPVTEPAILALTAIADSTPLLAPDAYAFERIRDKEHVLALAAELGIAVPEQVVLRSPADAADLDRLGFPIVIKPARSVAVGPSGRTKSSVSYAEDLVDLKRRLDALPGEVYPVMLQERIVGAGEGVFLLVWDGRVVARFAHRRIREKPPSGGVSVCCESIALDRDLVGRCERLLADFGWNGVAMVEFKRSAATNEPYLMEINGRFWGSLQLAIDAGVDFPRLLLEAAEGLEPPSVEMYRTGVREHWEWGEVDHYLARLRAEGLRNSWSLIRDAFQSAASGLRRRDRTEVLRLSDPWPFLSESADWLGSVLRKRVG